MLTSAFTALPHVISLNPDQPGMGVRVPGFQRLICQGQMESRYWSGSLAPIPMASFPGIVLWPVEGIS
jgi:hypothetical protein